MSGLKTRIVTGLTFGAIVFGCIFGGKLSFTILFFLITALCMWEFYTHILEDKNPRTHLIRKLIGMFLGLLPFEIIGISLYQNLPIGSYLMPVLLGAPVLFFLTFIFELYTKTERPFANIGAILLGVFYIGVPFALLDVIAFRDGDYSPFVVFGLLGMVWANDTSAYFSGRFLGKHKLFPRISPKKTWEGSIGGTIGTLIVALLINQVFPNSNLTLVNWLVLALIVSVFGAYGDLVESMLKRSLGIKDSGTLLPGHGGFLDRFDAFIFLLPFAAFYLWFC